MRWIIDPKLKAAAHVEGHTVLINPLLSRAAIDKALAFADEQIRKYIPPQKRSDSKTKDNN